MSNDPNDHDGRKRPWSKWIAPRPEPVDTSNSAYGGFDYGAGTDVDARPRSLAEQEPLGPVSVVPLRHHPDLPSGPAADGADAFTDGSTTAPGEPWPSATAATAAPDQGTGPDALAPPGTGWAGDAHADTPWNQPTVVSGAADVERPAPAGFDDPFPASAPGQHALSETREGPDLLAHDSHPLAAGPTAPPVLVSAPLAADAVESDGTGEFAQHPAGDRSSGDDHDPEFLAASPHGVERDGVDGDGVDGDGDGDGDGVDGDGDGDGVDGDGVDRVDGAADIDGDSEPTTDLSDEDWYKSYLAKLDEEQVEDDEVHGPERTDVVPVIDDRYDDDRYAEDPDDDRDDRARYEDDDRYDDEPGADDSDRRPRSHRKSSESPTFIGTLAQKWDRLDMFPAREVLPQGRLREPIGVVRKIGAALGVLLITFALGVAVAASIGVVAAVLALVIRAAIAG